MRPLRTTVAAVKVISPLRLAALLALAVLPAFGQAPHALAFDGPKLAGELGAPPRNEASGLAASRLSPDVLWIHDDSGGASALYAVGTNGPLLRKLDITKVKNDDWEDIASADLDGKAWLVIADIGDNDARRKSVSIHFIAEPEPEVLQRSGKASAAPAATLQVTYSDGPRDCESLAVDPRERALYLLSKRDLVPRLYRIALPQPLGDTAVVAEFVTEVSSLARPANNNALSMLMNKGFARPCGMDFAPDGSAAAVVMPVEVVVFPREPGESWADAFSRQPLRLAPHELPQAEAVCFSRDGRSLYVASEETRKLLRYDRR